MTISQIQAFKNTNPTMNLIQADIAVIKADCAEFAEVSLSLTQDQNSSNETWTFSRQMPIPKHS